MRLISVIMVGAGLIWLVAALNMTTTVETEPLYVGSAYIPSKTVNNVGLMNQQRNHIELSGLMILIGVVLLVSSIHARKSETIVPDNDASTGDDDSYHGERDIEIPSYQLYLTKKYSIEKNATLEKYVIGDVVFDSLRESLLHASEFESHRIFLRQQELAKLNKVAPALKDVLFEKLKQW